SDLPAALFYFSRLGDDIPDGVGEAVNTFGGTNGRGRGGGHQRMVAHLYTLCAWREGRDAAGSPAIDLSCNRYTFTCTGWVVQLGQIRRNVVFSMVYEVGRMFGYRWGMRQRLLASCSLGMSLLLSSS